MEAVGPVLIILSLPLIMRLVPPNRIYGFRIPATLRDRSVWYDVNARSGRHFLLLGVLLVILEFLLPAPMRTTTLRAVAITGLATIIVVDWRAATRWARQRRTA